MLQFRRLRCAGACPAQLETIYLGDRKITIHTAILEEKATACNMLCCYASELNDGFYPYVEQVCLLLGAAGHLYQLLSGSSRQKCPSTVNGACSNSEHCFVRLLAYIVSIHTLEVVSSTVHVTGWGAGWEVTLRYLTLPLGMQIILLYMAVFRNTCMVVSLLAFLIFPLLRR